MVGQLLLYVQIRYSLLRKEGWAFDITGAGRLHRVKGGTLCRGKIFDHGPFNYGQSKNHFAIRAMSIEMAANANKPQAEPARGTIEKTKAGFLTR
jgi:hypothetical protein